jgi:hypothetical protein
MSSFFVGGSLCKDVLEVNSVPISVDCGLRPNCTLQVMEKILHSILHLPIASRNNDDPVHPSLRYAISNQQLQLISSIGAGSNKMVVAKWPISGFSSSSSAAFLSYAPPTISYMASALCDTRSLSCFLFLYFEFTYLFFFFSFFPVC